MREINPRYSISLTINHNGNYCCSLSLRVRAARRRRRRRRPRPVFAWRIFRRRGGASPSAVRRRNRQINYRYYLILPRDFSTYISHERRALFNGRFRFFVVRFLFAKSSARRFAVRVDATRCNDRSIAPPRETLWKSDLPTRTSTSISVYFAGDPGWRYKITVRFKMTITYGKTMYSIFQYLLYIVTIKIILYFCLSIGFG